jgi:hypothetical protein
MYESKEEITVAADAVYALARKLDRGDILTHQAITRVLHLAPHQGRWDHIVNKVRKRLEGERGIATWPEIGVGYKLLTPPETLELPTWRNKRAARQMRRGRKSLQALPDNILSLHQRRSKLFLIDRQKESERALRREMRAQVAQLKPTQTLPRRPPQPPAREELRA